jgi:hypothetical protein
MNTRPSGSDRSDSAMHVALDIFAPMAVLTFAVLVIVFVALTRY